MTTKSILTVALATVASTSFAQKNFTVNTSANYTAKIAVAKCEDGTCSGKGTIELYTKGSSTLFQKLASKDLYFNLDSNNNPSGKMEMYDEESPLFFGDFNFDGSEDLAIRNGNNSGYSGPSYDVYVYQSTKKQFVKSKELTTLASTNLGMFDIDKERKRLIAYQKSGAAYHVKTEYEIVAGKGLVKVEEETEDASKGDVYVFVTTKKLVKGKWKTATKKYKQKDYYKD